MLIEVLAPAIVVDATGYDSLHLSEALDAPVDERLIERVHIAALGMPPTVRCHFRRNARNRVR
jgi:hypothetical protein